MVQTTSEKENRKKQLRQTRGVVMKPIKVVRKLVEDNPNDMQLGELIRQYIREQYGWKKIKTKNGHGLVNR